MRAVFAPMDFLFVDSWLTQSLLVINEKIRGIELRTLPLSNVLLNFWILFRIMPKIVESIRIHFHVVERDRYHSESGACESLVTQNYYDQDFPSERLEKEICWAGGQLHQ